MVFPPFSRFPRRPLSLQQQLEGSSDYEYVRGGALLPTILSTSESMSMSDHMLAGKCSCSVNAHSIKRA
eukprot:4276432-Amphidinium_carterae.1